MIIADVNAAKAGAVAAEIEMIGRRAMAVDVDVADEASVEAMINKVIGAYGRVDVLINNASLFSNLAKRPFEEISLADWRRVMDVNVTGAGA